MQWTKPVALLVEGTGVEPNVLVPKTREALLSGEDYVLQAAVQRLLQPLSEAR